MSKAFRYALAAICIAASVSCLALWAWSAIHSSTKLTLTYRNHTKVATIRVRDGVAFLNCRQGSFVPKGSSDGLRLIAIELQGMDSGFHHSYIKAFGLFGLRNNTIYFPLWYPALVFALAGVVALRVGRFTIRSALIGMTIVAVLLGMVVVL